MTVGFSSKHYSLLTKQFLILFLIFEYYCDFCLYPTYFYFIRVVFIVGVGWVIIRLLI